MENTRSKRVIPSAMVGSHSKVESQAETSPPGSKPGFLRVYLA